MAQSLKTFLVSLCLFTLLASCGGGGGGTPVPTLAGPTNLVVTQDYAGGVYLRFTWARPADPCDGYELEANLGTGTFAKAGSTIPYNYSSVGAGWDAATIPESSDLQFRIRAVKGTSYSAYSNVATFHVGLYPPQIASVDNSAAGITVKWINNSVIATTLQLERGLTSDYGGTYLWTPLADAAFGSTSYLDTKAPENTDVAYRVTYARGADHVSTISSYTHISLRSPTSLAAVPQAEGAKLTWQNNSTAAMAVVVTRASGFETYSSFQDIAQLPATATSYTDLQLATGYYTYRIEARQGTGAAARSAPVQVVTLPVTASKLSLKPAIVALPDGTMGARDAQGGWYFTQNTNYSFWNMVPPVGSATPFFILPSATALAAPSLALDAKGYPHTVYLRTVVQNSSEQAIVHAWFDGSAWQTEEVARRTLANLAFGQGLQFALDGTGTPHLVWATNAYSSTGLEYAYKAADGSWLTESLDVFSPALSSLFTMKLAVDGTGTPAVFLGSYSSLYLVERQGPKQWRAQTIPAGTTSNGFNSFYELLYTRTGDLHLFYLRQHAPSGSSFDLDLCEIVKSGGSWSAVKPLATLANTISLDQAAAVQSSQSERIALSYCTAGGHQVMICDLGVWSTFVIGPSSYTRAFMGFDGADKFYLLQPVVHSYGTTLSTYVLYTEAP